MADVLGAVVTLEYESGAGRLKNTIRFYGCPAKETLAGKSFVAAAGLVHVEDVARLEAPGVQANAHSPDTRARIAFGLDF